MVMLLCMLLRDVLEASARRARRAVTSASRLFVAVRRRGRDTRDTRDTRRFVAGPVVIRFPRRAAPTRPRRASPTSEASSRTT